MLANGRIGQRYLLVLASLAAAACSDRTQVTNPLIPGGGSRAAAAPPNGSKVKVKQFQLSSNTLNVEGPSVTGNVSIGNSGGPIDNVAVRGQIVQGAASRIAVTAQLTCAGNPGTLPNGTCTMNFTAAASNSADGSGTLVPGAAVFVLDVVQDPAGAATVLASKSLNVNLVGAVAITSLALQSTTLVIDGASVGWTATLNNPGGSLNNVILQGEILQGTAEKGAGGLSVVCGSAIGVLPPGTCTVSSTATASNSAGGSGVLAPGAASFRLQLIESNGSTSTVLDTKTIAITLVAAHVGITSVSANPVTFAIDGPATTVTVVLENTNAGPVTDLQINETLVQEEWGASRAAGTAVVSCGAGPGVLPVGTCTMTLPASASNSTAGSGTLQAQVANLTVDLVTPDGGGQTLDSKSIPVGLELPPTPVISNFSIASAYIVLDGTGTSYGATLENQNVNSFSDTWLALDIVEGNAVVASTSSKVDCNAGAGVLPNGTCNVSGTLALSSSNTSIALGGATLRVRLFRVIPSPLTITTFDTKTVPITIVASTPSIVKIEFQSTTLPIGESVSYTVMLYNPTNQTLTLAGIQGEMIQGTTLHGAGGTDVLCGGAGGSLPPGACTFQFTAIASNSTAGTGTFVPGTATFRLTFSVFDSATQQTTDYDVKTVTVTLVNP